MWAATVNGGKPAKPASAQNSKQHMKNGSAAKIPDSPRKHAHDRSLFLFAQCVGKDAAITLKNGEQFTGVFSGGHFEANKSQYVIKMAKRTKYASSQQANGVSELPSEYIGEGEDHTLTFDIQDTADMHVQGVVMAAAAPQQNGSIGSSFLTDTQISSRDSHTPRERDLQPWKPDANSSIDMSLEASGGTGWDQFAVNERMYGVHSSYDENMYTTAIDHNNPRYKQRQAEADRIAREIERSTPADAHVAEERRRDASREEGGDEEDKYSGVKRDASALPRRTHGAYVPPSQRPMTGAPSVPGVPFDPAIISSQLAKPNPSISTPIAQAPAPAAPSPKPVAIAEQQLSTPQASEMDTTAAAPSNDTGKRGKGTTTEDHVRGTADAFKQFANNEKLRLKQAQEAKRSNLKQEKNVRLNDLKKFAANFKLKSRVPDDLVPILAKDREKQIDIQTKAEAAAKEEELKSKERESVGAPSPATSTTTTQPAPAPQVEQRPPYGQHSRSRVSQQMRAQQPFPQGQSPRAPLSQRIQGNQFGRTANPPAEIRIPPNFAHPAQHFPQSPNSARLNLNANAKAFEFRPAASAFTPSSPSPQRMVLGPGASPTPIASFHDSRTPPSAVDGTESFGSSRKLVAGTYPEAAQKTLENNGGVPQAYSTPPTWTATEPNEATMHIDSFPKAIQPTPPPPPMQQRPQYWQQQPQHMPNFRNSPNVQFRQPYGGGPPPQQQHQQYPGMPPMPPQFQQQPPPQQQQQHFQPPPPYPPMPNFQNSPGPHFRNPFPLGPPHGYGGMPPPGPQFQGGYMR